MTPLWLSHVLIIIALLIGTITDFRKREVPDFLNFTLMGIGVALGILNSVASSSIVPFVGSVIGLTSGYLLGALMFYTGQWGGGDAKMLMGIGAVLGIDIRYFWMSGVELPLFFTVVISILVAGTFYGLLFAVYLIFNHRKAFVKAFKERIKEPSILQARVVVIIIVVILITLAFLNTSILHRWMLGVLALFIFGGFYLVVVGKLIEKICMVKTIKVANLTEGEWIANDVIVKGKRICGPKDLGISKENIQKLKKLKVKEVLVKEGIPFIPGFLLGYITVLIYGNWLLTILGVL